MYQKLWEKRQGDINLQNLKLDARQDCDHHNYWVFNDVVLPTMNFCIDLGIVGRDIGLSRLDLFDIMANTEDIFASVPYVYEKLDES